jgi:hypothetical protein
MDPSTRRVYWLVAWISIGIIVACVIYGFSQSLLGSKQSVGEVWVNVYWPFPPYFAQPVSYFAVASVALFYSGLRLTEGTVARWPVWFLMTLQVFGFIVAFSAAYEVMYNFMLWGSSYSVACADAIHAGLPCDPDTLNSLYPTSWNLVFATRAFAALFVISGYSVYYLRRFSDGRLI